MIPGGLDTLAKNMGRAAALRHRSTDMITRTIKYTASDGTEHESPQAAAEHNLTQQIRAIGVEAVGCTYYEQLARNPEALRDALDAYFEDLEAHPDVDGPGEEDGPWADGYDVRTGVALQVEDHRICAICDGGPGNNCACTCGMKKWVEPDPKADNRTGDPDDPSTWRVEQHEGEIAPGVRGFEMVVGASHTMPKDKDRYIEGTLPVDHPQYCRPFGTRED